MNLLYYKYITNDTKVQIIENKSFTAKFSLFNLLNKLPIHELEEIIRELNQLLLHLKKKEPTEIYNSMPPY